MIDPEGRPIVDSPQEALEKMSSDYDSYRIVATLSFAKETKVQILGELEHVVAETSRAINQSRERGLEESASDWRKVQEFVRAQREEIRMWIFAGEQNFHASWECLVSAQGAAYWAARWLPSFLPAQLLEAHLTAVERVLFPKQMFFSPSLIINERDVECSICSERAGDCDHLVGEIYAGEVASRIIHGIEGVREVSIVEYPANKRSRAFTVGKLDSLTGLPVDL